MKVECQRGFEKAEFERRTRALQSGMADCGLDALLFTTEAEIRYVTGFLTRFWESPARPWFVVLPAAGSPVAVIPAIGRELMAATWIEDIRCWMSPDPADEGVSLLAGTIAEAAPPNGLVGLEMAAETHLRMPLADFHRLQAAVGPRKFTDATSIIRHVREIKSEAEIAKIKAACSIAGAAFDKVPGIAKIGRLLDRVFRDFQIECLNAGADHVGYLAGGAGPDGYRDVISPPAPIPLSQGDILMLDTGVVFDGYYCDFDRNFAIGQASEVAKRAYAALFQATEAGFAAVRPGKSASDVWRAMRNLIENSGFQTLEGRLGHGLGMQLTEWPSLNALDETILREGMVLTLEPGLQISPGRIMVHEENIVVRASRAELLSPRAAPELPLL